MNKSTKSLLLAGAVIFGGYFLLKTLPANLGMFPARLYGIHAMYNYGQHVRVF